MLKLMGCAYDIVYKHCISTIYIYIYIYYGEVGGLGALLKVLIGPFQDGAGKHESKKKKFLPGQTCKVCPVLSDVFSSKRQTPFVEHNVPSQKKLKRLVKPCPRNSQLQLQLHSVHSPLSSVISNIVGIGVGAENWEDI